MRERHQLGQRLVPISCLTELEMPGRRYALLACDIPKWNVSLLPGTKEQQAVFMVIMNGDGLDQSYPCAPGPLWAFVCREALPTAALPFPLII